VDNDLGFLLWISQTLVEAGYAAFPAGSVENASALAEHLADELEALVMNPRINGAPEFVQWLRSRHPMLKVIALLEAGKSQELPAVDGAVAKESENGPGIIQLLEHVLAPQTLAAEPLLLH